jgi:callose synthase
MPDYLCYIYHHMATELHCILEGFIDTTTGRPANPTMHGENAFLVRVVTPIYDIIRAKAESSRDGKAPHATWRNYDDINEYFMHRDVFDRLGWPMDQSCQFFHTLPDRSHVCKTGFVEVRSFWNIYRNFDRLWVMLLLYLQAAAIVACEGAKWSWDDLLSSRGSEYKDTQVRVLTVFITWAALRFLQSLLNIGTQFRHIFRDGQMIVVCMVLKVVVAVACAVAFSVLYKRVWNQRTDNGQWSSAADSRMRSFLYAATAFVILEVLAIVLFIEPWVRNALEKTNWKICYALTWWFQSRSFVGRGLCEGTFDNVKYSIFWVLLLAVKFDFSYFLQIRLLVKPTKEIYKLNGI